MHFSAMYSLRWYRRAFTRNWASNKWGVGNASKSLARCSHFSCFDKTNQVLL